MDCQLANDDIYLIQLHLFIIFQIYKFWNNMEQAVGRTNAQNVMPHITLFTYFQVC